MLSTVNAQELPWNRLGIAGASGAELFVRGVETPVPVDLDDSTTCGSAEPAASGRGLDCRALEILPNSRSKRLRISIIAILVSLSFMFFFFSSSFSLSSPPMCW